MSLPLCGLLATLLQVLHDDVHQSVIFVTMHEKRGTVNATTDHTDVLDAGTWRGTLWDRAVLMEFRDGE